MQHGSFPRHVSSMLCLVLAASACAADDEDEDTGAGTDTATASATSPVTDATDPTNPTAADDDGDTTDTPGDDTGPADDGASMTDPTVADDDGSSGDEVADDGGSSDDGATTGIEGSSVFGTVTRSGGTAIAAGNDGIGIFYVGLLAECSQDAMSFGGNGVMVDVSQADTPAVWQIDGVPDGHYFLAGFLDDNGNADMNDPYADMGDLAAAEGFGPACLEITVAGDEVAAGQFVLNIAVPF